MNLTDASKNVSFIKHMAGNAMEDPLHKIIQEIADLVKYKKDYTQAISLLKQNNLKLEELIKRTTRIRNDELIILANILISKKL